MHCIKFVTDNRSWKYWELMILVRTNGWSFTLFATCYGSKIEPVRWNDYGVNGVLKYHSSRIILKDISRSENRILFLSIVADQGVKLQLTIHCSVFWNKGCLNGPIDLYLFVNIHNQQIRDKTMTWMSLIIQAVVSEFSDKGSLNQPIEVLSNTKYA